MANKHGVFEFDSAGGGGGASVTAFDTDAAQFSTGVLGETIPRRLVNHNWTFGPTSGVSYLFAVSLAQNAQVGHLIAWFTGAATSQTHFWLGLCDASRNLLAATADRGTTAVVSGANSLPIATTASGAATSFTTAYSGLYYIHFYLAATSVPALYTNVSVSASTGTGTAPWQASPALCAGLSGGAQQATPPTFPYQFSGSWTNTFDALGYLQVAG